MTVAAAGPAWRGKKVTTRWHNVPRDTLHDGVTDQSPPSPLTEALASKAPPPFLTVSMALFGTPGVVPISRAPGTTSWLFAVVRMV